MHPKGSPSARAVTEAFAFRATDYYAALIDWNDPDDPIRRLIVPDDQELLEFGSEDASNEANNTVLPGLQHKYPDTALLLVTDQCAGFCRYCFRKRLFSERNRETLHNWRPAVKYIAGHPEITDVLLTGGDPLTLSTPALRTIVHGILDIPHVQTIRIGSKVPAFNPSRIYDDHGLLDLVKDIAAADRAPYIMTHFDHPKELTQRALRAVSALRNAGAQCLNQCPITRGINDDAEILAYLFELTARAGCPQYYVFQCRPTSGNGHFILSLEEAFEIVDKARSMVSGLSRRARLCMSHESGKVEIVGLDATYLYARYHRAKNPADEGRMLLFQRNPNACWMEDLTLVDW